MRKLTAYLRPILTTFCQIFCQSACRKNGEECEPATVFSFEHLSQRYLIEKKYLHSTYLSTVSWKHPEKSRSHEHGKGTRLTASSSRRAPFEALFEAGEQYSATPIQLRFKELHFGFRARDKISQAVRYLFHRSSFYKCNHRILQRVHNISWYCELSRMKGSVELLSRAMRTIDMIDY